MEAQSPQVLGSILFLYNFLHGLWRTKIYQHTWNKVNYFKTISFLRYSDVDTWTSSEFKMLLFMIFLYILAIQICPSFHIKRCYPFWPLGSNWWISVRIKRSGGHREMVTLGERTGRNWTELTRSLYWSQCWECRVPATSPGLNRLLQWAPPQGEQKYIKM